MKRTLFATGVTAALLGVTGPRLALATAIPLNNPGFESAYTDSSQTTPYTITAGDYSQGFGTVTIINGGNGTTRATAYVPGWTGNSSTGEQAVAGPNTNFNAGYPDGNNFA